jgi:hypothetical protein
MDIWIPEPLYRIFPKMNVLLGSFFTIVASGKVSLALSLALVGYGTWMLVARAVGR